MGLFSNQFANVVEWEEWNDEMIFWKWTNREIKKGSRLMIRPGQDAIFIMKWISKEGKDMFNLQANAFDIAKGIKEDLDMQIIKDGITITSFHIMSFNYPDEVQKMIEKNASHSMIGNMNTYTQASMVEGMSSGKMKGGGAASDMAGMMMGMQAAGQMMQNVNMGGNTAPLGTPATAKPNFCPNCGTKTGDGNFCSNCGHKLA